MQTPRHLAGAGLALICGLAVLAAGARAADQPQWGQKDSRNMASAETGLPDSFDPKSGQNIRWRATLGSQTYATPTVAGGCVFIGTNNDNPRDPRQRGDRGVFMCLDEKDGTLRWQLVVPKLEPDRYQDWPQVGMCSPATVEGNRVYMLTNRDEVVCLDLAGMANGNDGPFKDEAKHMAAKDGKAVEPGRTDADLVWLYDIPGELGTWPHDTGHASILVHGDHLYINTCNGVDNTHRKIRRPEAPSLIVLDKKTGKLVAKDEEAVGTKIIHSTWSSPALGEVGGLPLVFFAGGDGILRAFKALPPAAAAPARLEKVWWFDPDPGQPHDPEHSYQSNRNEGPSDVNGMPVVVGRRVYLAGGGDFQWGKHKGWVKCIDATRTGDVTTSAEVWSYTAMRDTCATPAVAGGLVYVTDCGGTVYCLDAETGQPVWTHKMKGDIWDSALVADGKVYVGTQRGDFAILAAGREKKVLASVDLGAAIAGTPVAANGVLYITTANTLFAVQAPKGVAK
jgi:outer membrane protein assembly factor BamB